MAHAVCECGSTQRDDCDQPTKQASNLNGQRSGGRRRTVDATDDLVHLRAYSERVSACCTLRCSDWRAAVCGVSSEPLARASGADARSAPCGLLNTAPHRAAPHPAPRADAAVGAACPLCAATSSVLRHQARQLRRQAGEVAGAVRGDRWPRACDRRCWYSGTSRREGTAIWMSTTCARRAVLSAHRTLKERCPRPRWPGGMPTLPPASRCCRPCIAAAHAPLPHTRGVQDSPGTPVAASEQTPRGSRQQRAL